MGINRDFVGWLSRVAATSTSRLLVNGHLSPPFPIERSVRQGEPLAMDLFVLYLHPLLTRVERVCNGDLCVAYADDVTVIATSIQTAQRIFRLFDCFQIVAGAKLNRHKTVAIDVGFINGDPLLIPELHTAEKVKVLGVFFANSVRLMVKLNWDDLVNKIRQIIWMHSMRCLNLQQKIILLNTFITSKVWYLSSILPPQCVHTAKITSSMGTFLFRGVAARVPIQQLARRKDQGGLNLQLPAIKCKAMLINRHLQEMDFLPFYQHLLSQNIPPPADLPCLKLISQQLPLLPQHIQQNPSSNQIHRVYLEQTEIPRVERNHPGTNWKKI